MTELADSRSSGQVCTTLDEDPALEAAGTGNEPVADTAAAGTGTAAGVGAGSGPAKPAEKRRKDKDQKKQDHPLATAPAFPRSANKAPLLVVAKGKPNRPSCVRWRAD